MTSLSEKSDASPAESETPRRTGDTNLAATKAETRLHETSLHETSLQDGGARSGVDVPGYEYPDTSALVSITIALCLAILPVALDTTILAAAIPTITDYFGSAEDIAWYVGAYPLTICAFQLAYGKLYTLYSIKWVYISSIAIFEIGSAVCGWAPSSASLIVGRAVAGIGCAGIICGSFVIVNFAVPTEKRPFFQGVVGGIFGVALIAGPPIGGALSSNVTWRWCFWINLPLGAASAVVIMLLYKSPPRVQQGQSSWLGKIKEMDPLGTFVLVVSVTCLFLALTWGGAKYSWNSGTIIALLVLMIFFMLLYVATQYFNKTHATIPERLIRQRSVAAACWYGFCMSGAGWVMVYFIPIWFQAVLEVSAAQSGVYMLAAILPAVATSVLGGAYITVFGYYNPILIIGSIFSAAGAGCLTLLKADASHAQWIGYQVIYGIGFGFAVQAPEIVVQTVLPPEDIPAGISLIVFTQSIGGAILVAVTQSIFFNKLIAGLSVIIGPEAAASAVSEGTTNYQGQIPAEILSPVLEAFNYAIVTSWYGAVAIASLSIVGALACEWRSVKGGHGQAVSTSH
ncbi:hypothetical protein AMS68_000099 [Peltaster fructicola]|uniref:Major facilitator superfamily (MFS) profile domain-containing protein n=1 Tax=Peltaster fructicola TaxID=286661 RepID=A0A6H0XIN9_9PEZI|nr:hypothetical protein AMS68_000099 [Peltaster fructicola]